MKKTRHTETQIIKILKSQESGQSVTDLCREHGISQATFYNWKSKYGGMDANQLKKMKEMEAELSQFKRMYADLAFENNALKNLIEKKPLRPVDKRAAVGYLVKEEHLSIRRACTALSLSISVYYYRFKAKTEDRHIIDELEKLAEAYPTYGFKKMYYLLRSKGYLWNHKRVYRVYVMMSLNIRRKRKRRLPARIKTPHIIPVDCNITWSMDFMQDTLISGKSFRTFNVIDDHNREALMIGIDTSLSARRIVRDLDRLISWRGTPKVVRVDNGPEFTSAVFDSWARKHSIKICFTQPGKPTQNSLIERFNGSYRKEVLDAHLFFELNQVRDQTQTWLWNYNNIRPHKSLGYKTPVNFVKQRSKTRFASLIIDQHLMENTIFESASI
ncbi:IS3 family transposase [Zhouia spongiae]|uniref:IS3 family transposase n=1 Tax=Zhouia spongiae TaxID=2202721 RepID=UPI003BFA7380